MSEYTYSDVIIDPNDERVKIGEKYWASCTAAKSCIDSANANEPLVELIRITMEVRYPFHIKYSDGVETDCCCLSKPKELKVTCALDLDNDEEYQFRYLPKDLLPLVTYSKNNNVVMVDPNKLKIELLLRPIEKIR